MAILSTLNIDFKPYLCGKTLHTWGLRIKRLEQKMNIVHPELIALALELNWEALNMLN